MAAMGGIMGGILVCKECLKGEMCNNDSSKSYSKQSVIHGYQKVGVLFKPELSLDIISMQGQA